MIKKSDELAKCSRMESTHRLKHGSVLMLWRNAIRYAIILQIIHYILAACNISMNPISKRVVVTGIGLVSPLGCGNINIWNRILNKETGIQELRPEAKVPGSDVHIAARVPRPNDNNSASFSKNELFDEKVVFGRSVCKEFADFTQFALHASDLAIADAGNPILSNEVPNDRVGVAISSGIGAIQDIVDTSAVLEKSGMRRISPYFIPKILINMASGNVSIRHKLYGPCHSTVTACAASAHSIGDAYNFIRMGYADMMLAGGSESCISSIAISGFAKMRALSNGTDATACRPFDAARNGFVLGEGASVLVLEDMELARKRGANILCELVGYGMSADGYHITSPPPNGDGAIRAMQVALRDAGIAPHSIGYINAHATSTPVGDQIEMNAIETVFKGRDTVAHLPPLYVSSTKGATGHLLGASGALEASMCVFSLQSGKIPPTLNLQTPCAASSGTPSGIILPTEAVDQSYLYAMSNSFGFGGTNVSLIFKKYEL